MDENIWKWPTKASQELRCLSVISRWPSQTSGPSNPWVLSMAACIYLERPNMPLTIQNSRSKVAKSAKPKKHVWKVTRNGEASLHLLHWHWRHFSWICSSFNQPLEVSCSTQALAFRLLDHRLTLQDLLGSSLQTRSLPDILSLCKWDRIPHQASALLGPPFLKHSAGSRFWAMSTAYANTPKLPSSNRTKLSKLTPFASPGLGLRAWTFFHETFFVEENEQKIPLITSVFWSPQLTTLSSWQLGSPLLQPLEDLSVHRFVALRLGM